MNKKGFTLIELLCSITIISLITTIASINVISIFDTKKEQSIKNVNEIIETAACTYIELNKNKNLKENCLNNSCEINSDTLVKEGLLKEEDYKEVTIKIYKDNNEKKCVIK
ncbi:MAG: prepilin-type N-terminal cleavage/methylation domain-containing protein [Firmicutes bacterium]|nr:prepilin-type N-terminal cleavage/methylation domain-containing protein [Bacillota bacterium]